MKRRITLWYIWDSINECWELDYTETGWNMKNIHPYGNQMKVFDWAESPRRNTVTPSHCNTVTQ